VNWKRAGIAALCVVPLILLFGFGLTHDPKEIPSPLPGHQASPFALTVFAPGEPPLARAPGDTVRLADLKGQVVVLNFWASWCLSCRDEHQILSQTAMDYAGKPVHFLGVLYNDEPANGTKWIAQMGGQSYPSVTDPGARTAIDYGLYGVPETYFLDATGRIAYKATGPVNERIIRYLVDSLMAAATK
jgi:cytochrome c biogenesis protein CcmG/thiol:disulfide interchange protein DsbE